VIALKAEHRLEVLLDVAGLPRSTFFYHQARMLAPDPQAAKTLKSSSKRFFLIPSGLPSLSGTPARRSNTSQIRIG
jgi:hypothetical protein